MIQFDFGIYEVAHARYAPQIFPGQAVVKFTNGILSVSRYLRYSDSPFISFQGLLRRKGRPTVAFDPQGIVSLSQTINLGRDSLFLKLSLNFYIFLRWLQQLIQ